MASTKRYKKYFENLSVGDIVSFTNKAGEPVSLKVTKVDEKSWYGNGGRNSYGTLYEYSTLPDFKIMKGLPVMDENVLVFSEPVKHTENLYIIETKTVWKNKNTGKEIVEPDEKQRLMYAIYPDQSPFEKLSETKPVYVGTIKYEKAKEISAAVEAFSKKFNYPYLDLLLESQIKKQFPEHNKPAPATLNKTLIRTLNIRNEEVKVYTVNATFVRQNHDADWNSGGHLRGWNNKMTYIPDGEIWIDETADNLARNGFILHEAHEFAEMKYDKLNYDKAHDHANKVEQDYLYFVNTLGWQPDELLDMWLNGIYEIAGGLKVVIDGKIVGKTGKPKTYLEFIKELTEKSEIKQGEINITPESMEKNNDKPSTESKQRFGKVKEVDRSEITTMPDLFQGRQKEYSEESVAKIVSEGFDKSNDPIVVWWSPDKNKYVVISGHSRWEASRRLYEQGDKSLKKMPVKEFLGDIEEARSYAIIESNRASTPEGLLSDINAVRTMMKEGYNKANMDKYIKPRSKLDNIINYTHLNPDGKFIEQLTAPSQQSFGYVERNAAWVGYLRKAYGDKLTNYHENEIFDFIYTSGSKEGLKMSKENLFKLIDKKVMAIDFDSSKPLNLKNIVSTSGVTNPVKALIKEVEEDIKYFNDEIEKKRTLIARAKAENITDMIPKFEEFISQSNQKLLELHDKKLNLEAQMQKMERETTVDLFSMVGEPEKQPDLIKESNDMENEDIKEVNLTDAIIAKARYLVSSEAEAMMWDKSGLVLIVNTKDNLQCNIFAMRDPEGNNAGAVYIDNDGFPTIALHLNASAFDKWNTKAKGLEGLMIKHFTHDKILLSNNKTLKAMSDDEGNDIGFFDVTIAGDLKSEIKQSNDMKPNEAKKIEETKTRIFKNMRGEWKAETTRTEKGQTFQITTHKSYSGSLITTATKVEAMETSEATINRFSPLTDTFMRVDHGKVRVTENTIKEAHYKALAEFDLKIAETPTKEIRNEEPEKGDILFLDGYGKSKGSEGNNWIIYDIVNDKWGVKYHCIEKDTLELRVKDHVKPFSKKFGIGIYFEKGYGMAHFGITEDKLSNMLIEAQDVKKKADEEKRIADEAAKIKREEKEKYLSQFQKADRRKTTALIKKYCLEHFDISNISVSTDVFSMGDSMDVKYTSPEKIEALEAWISNFQYGHFNSMEDIYEYNKGDEPIIIDGYILETYKYVSVRHVEGAGKEDYQKQKKEQKLSSTKELFNEIKEVSPAMQRIEHELTMQEGEKIRNENIADAEEKVENCNRDLYDFAGKYGKKVIEPGITFDIAEYTFKVINMDSEKIYIQKITGRFEEPAKVSIKAYDEFIELYSRGSIMFDGYAKDDKALFDLMLLNKQKCLLYEENYNDLKGMVVKSVDAITEKNNLIIELEQVVKDGHSRLLEAEAENERLKRELEIQKTEPKPEPTPAPEISKESIIEALDGLKIALEYAEESDKADLQDAVNALEVTLEYL